jgi:hypothetical protein
MSSPPQPNLARDLGPDSVELLRACAEDLIRHEAAVNEHHRTALTIRGFALTAVAALIASGFASDLALPEYFAIGTALLFLFADFYYSRLYTEVRRPIPVLESLLRSHRRLLGRRIRSDTAILELRGDLRAYGRRPVIPVERPNLWPPRPLGRLSIFMPLYLALIAAATGSAIYIEQRGAPEPAEITERYIRLCDQFKDAEAVKLRGLRIALRCP